MEDNNVVIKALECCVDGYNCCNCPFKNEISEGCKYTVCDFDAIVLDFMKHQRAQIEHLRNDNQYLQNRRWKELSEVRTEAIKEFAERLKDLSCFYDIYNYHSFRAVDIENIDYLIKEMTEKDNEYGHWTRELVRNDKGGCVGAKMICSHCKQDNKHDEYMKYCPNCGKKMKES